ncbi:MAG: phosphate/phosphite/phosphonate ABC transporter substrate-binding protein [Actinomycetota bacterium]|nr:phosphate/phosphite/phosphonate ABC transporter substrate-binding protein [Actinomycetota bacterium]
MSSATSADTAMSSASSAPASASGGGAPVTKPDKLTLALVPSSNGSTIMGSAKPLTDYLTHTLGIPVTASVTKDYPAAVEAIGADQAQIAFLPVLPMQQAVSRYGAIPALQVVRAGKTTYHTQFFTNEPSKYCAATPAAAGKDGYLYCNGTGGKADGPAGLDSLKKIEKGTKIAFVELTSSSGYIFPALDLKNAGIDPASAVTPIFTNGHDKAVLAVYNGQAPVGVSFDDARELVAKANPDVGKKLTVFALSEEIPNDGVVVGKSIDPAFEKQISDAIVAFSKTTDGKKTLNDLYQITDFAPADPKSLDIVAQAAAKLGLN